MLKIGLTGGIGSGKTAASDHFASLGIAIIDADIVARQVVEPGTKALSEITSHFGQEILEHGQLNRSALRKIIFADQTEKAWLEALLHPIIRTEIQSQLGQAGSPYAILVSPLMFETNQHELVDRTLLIDAPVESQVKRASARDQNTPEQIRAIVEQQHPREYKIKHADDIICNDRDLDYLKLEVERMHRYYLELSHEL